MQSKSFCKGLFCRKTDRHKCASCGIFVCNGCSDTFQGKNYCIDCLVPLVWNDIKKDVIDSFEDKERVVIIKGVKHELPA